MSDETKYILVERDGAVATVIINRPDKLNALSPDMMAGLLAALSSAAGDPKVGCVVLTGAGRTLGRWTDQNLLRQADACIALHPDAARDLPADDDGAVEEQRC